MSYRLEMVDEVRAWLHGSIGASEVRILFIFDPERRAVLLIAGDKAGQWSAWYREAIPLAEARYALYLKEREL
jgi:hypothetical protein